MEIHFLLFVLLLAATAVISFAYAIWRGRNDQQILRSILQSSPIPTFVISTNRKILYWNRALEGLSGIRAEEVLGTDQQWRAFYSSPRSCMADLIISKKIDHSYSLYAGKVAKSKILKYAYEVTEFFPDLGEKGKWFRITATSIRDSSGKTF
ncbi:MAG TPA: PAS domain-containing protein, partial [Smithellaceae bacterium]|nr:PAS domain-containing protein [Smithellaceae bacterium]